MNHDGDTSFIFCGLYFAHSPRPVAAHNMYMKQNNCTNYTVHTEKKTRKRYRKPRKGAGFF